MDEEQKTQENKTEETDVNSNKRFQSETISELDRADQIAERQKRENDRREELLTREEHLEARRRIGGGSEAGQSTEKPKEETDKEYSDRIDQEIRDGKYNG